MLHVNLIVLHINMNKLHVTCNIIMLYVGIIHLACYVDFLTYIILHADIIKYFILYVGAEVYITEQEVKKKFHALENLRKIVQPFMIVSKVIIMTTTCLIHILNSLR